MNEKEMERVLSEAMKVPQMMAGESVSPELWRIIFNGAMTAMRISYAMGSSSGIKSVGDLIEDAATNHSGTLSERLSGAMADREARETEKWVNGEFDEDTGAILADLPDPPQGYYRQSHIEEE